MPLSLFGSPKWRMGRLGSFLCSPNAHTRKGSKGWSGNHCFSKGETAWPVRTWLRNLFRPGLRPDGTSNNARHRLRDRADRAMHPRKAQAVTRPSPMEGAAQSSLEGLLDEHCVSQLPTATTTTGSCIQRKSQEAIHPHPWKRNSKRAWKEHYAQKERTGKSSWGFGARV
jgi:hypothetical protein